jgi:2-iminobutanoate/2-iminopropanoate deaminase
MKKMIFLILLTPLLLVVNCTEKPMDREVISSPNAPAAIGPYSQAIRMGNMLYLSGQLGIDPKTGKFAGVDAAADTGAGSEDGFDAQARQALENQKAVLAAAGFSLKDVVQCQVFVNDLKNYPTFNAIYKEYFKKDFPARAVLEVSRIPADGLVEIMMVAVKND